MHISHKQQVLTSCSCWLIEIKLWAVQFKLINQPKNVIFFVFFYLTELSPGLNFIYLMRLNSIMEVCPNVDW